MSRILAAPYNDLCLASVNLTRENARQKVSRKQWETVTIEGVTHVLLRSIPEQDRTQYGIPAPIQFASILQQKKLEQQSQDTSAHEEKKVLEEIEDLYHTLYQEKKNSFQPYYNQIKDKYALPVERIREFAQVWAVMAWVQANYTRSKNSLEILYNAINRVLPSRFANKHVLSNFLNSCKANGIEATCVDQRAIKKVQKRISTFQYEFIKSLYIQSQKYSAKAIHSKLVDACSKCSEKPYSLASVKLYMREMENNVELYGLRYGQTQVQKQLPYASLLPAEHRNTQWQMDGWTMPFWGQNFQRYVLYCIWDNHSRRIIGYSIGKTENTVLILEGMENAMRETGVLPAEMVSDAHSFHKTEIAKRFKEETAKMGMVWTVTTNAQRNQIAERYNQYFDPICKDFSGYLGKNVTAKGKNARPSQEALAELAKSSNWLSEDEIKAIAVYVVNTYNSTNLEALHGVSANEKYAASESLKAFVIGEEERVKLIRPIDTYKVIRGQINIKIGTVKHEFQLPAALISQYNNQRVKVVYEDLTEGIYLFDTDTEEYIDTIAPKRKMHGAVADQTEEDRKLLNQQTGRKNGTVTQARKKVANEMAAALEANPEAIELINSYALPKDIRQIAQQNHQLKRQLTDAGVNHNMMPIRAMKAACLPTMPAKTKESPFTPTNNEMRLMTPEEIYGVPVQK